MSDIQFLEAQPGLRVADIKQAYDFYHQLGFQKLFQNQDFHLVVRRNPVTLHLSTIEGQPQTGCQILIRGVDAFYEQVKKLGVTIAYEIGDRPWDHRDFTIADPDGNEITFSEPLDPERGGEIFLA